MLFAHHTPASAKQALVHEQGLVLPQMPVYAPSKHAAAPLEHQAVYESSYTCQSGHGVTVASYNGSDHVLPHWPAEVRLDYKCMQDNRRYGVSWLRGQDVKVKRCASLMRFDLPPHPSVLLL
jgi:hypothetical protein